MPPKLIKVAVIDLGSNTARLVVMHAVPGYSFRLEDEIREVVRLRHGITDDGLSEDAMSRAFSTLRLFSRFCQSYAVDLVLPTATSAVREAANGAEFAERVERELGLTLRILTGDEEAYYGTLGALNEVAAEEAVVLDIGGGSAQLSEVRRGRFHRGEALKLGALALTERFVRGDLIRASELEALTQEIERQLESLSWLKRKKGRVLIGLGGTIRNLASMEVERQRYPLNTFHGMSLSLSSVEESIALLRDLPLAERRRIPGLSSDRADIILPGAMVLATVMNRLGVEEVAISRGGLREGVFFEHFWQHLPYPVNADMRRFSVLNIARNYEYQKPHANHVRYLADRIFEQLTPLHGYGAQERELLDAAALLHDIGALVGYHGHHKHSQTLININGLPGFSAREIALIGLIARYHRKGTPDYAEYRCLLDDKDGKLLICLAAMLRLAEFLERGRNAAVDDIVAHWTDDELQLSLVADEFPAVELWESERHAVPLVEMAFKRRVALQSIVAQTVDATAQE